MHDLVLVARLPCIGSAGCITGFTSCQTPSRFCEILVIAATLCDCATLRGTQVGDLGAGATSKCIQDVRVSAMLDVNRQDGPARWPTNGDLLQQQPLPMSVHDFDVPWTRHEST